jgi:hypothetical protein
LALQLTSPMFGFCQTREGREKNKLQIIWF